MKTSTNEYKLVYTGMMALNNRVEAFTPEHTHGREWYTMWGYECLMNIPGYFSLHGGYEHTILLEERGIPREHHLERTLLY